MLAAIHFQERKRESVHTPCKDTLWHFSISQWVHQSALMACFRVWYPVFSFSWLTVQCAATERHLCRRDGRGPVSSERSLIIVANVWTASLSLFLSLALTKAKHLQALSYSLIFLGVPKNFLRLGIGGAGACCARLDTCHAFLIDSIPASWSGVSDSWMGLLLPAWTVFCPFFGMTLHVVTMQLFGVWVCVRVCVCVCVHIASRSVWVPRASVCVCHPVEDMSSYRTSMFLIRSLQHHIYFQGYVISRVRMAGCLAACQGPTVRAFVKKHNTNSKRRWGCVAFRMSGCEDLRYRWLALSFQHVHIAFKCIVTPCEVIYVLGYLFLSCLSGSLSLLAEPYIWPLLDTVRRIVVLGKCSKPGVDSLAHANPCCLSLAGDKGRWLCLMLCILTVCQWAFYYSKDRRPRTGNS